MLKFYEELTYLGLCNEVRSTYLTLEIRSALRFKSAATSIDFTILMMHS